MFGNVIGPQKTILFRHFSALNELGHVKIRTNHFVHCSLINQIKTCYGDRAISSLKTADLFFRFHEISVKRDHSSFTIPTDRLTSCHLLLT